MSLHIYEIVWVTHMLLTISFPLSMTAIDLLCVCKTHQDFLNPLIGLTPLRISRLIHAGSGHFIYELERPR